MIERTYKDAKHRSSTTGLVLGSLAMAVNLGCNMNSCPEA